MSNRFFTISEILAGIQEKDKAIKTIFHENERTNGVLWYVPPGEEIPAHYHPETDDIWVVLEGEGEYYLENGKSHQIKPGLVAVAAKEQIHGVKATGEKPLIVVAISAPMPVQMIKIDR
ncbi:MAG: cupin domain-containing protein [Bacillota bacterium]|nr:cupin domain-containing protein [Bacillota bacterium]